MTDPKCLTDEQVVEIRRLYWDVDMKIQRIAIRMGMTPADCADVATKKTYRHVKDPYSPRRRPPPPVPPIEYVWENRHTGEIVKKYGPHHWAFSLEAADLHRRGYRLIKENRNYGK